MNRGRAFLALLALLSVTALSTGRARAEERKNSWELGFLFGGTFAADEMKIENPSHAGLRLGWNFHPSYELEVQYLHDDDVALQSDGQASTLLADPTVFFANPARTFTSDSITARLLINPRNVRRRFKPYALFGAGVQTFTANPRLTRSQTGNDTSVVVNVGGGVRVRLTPHMAFRAEFETQYAPTDIYHDEHLNVGLTWVFGGGRPGDSDGDGILDLNDKCPDTPKGALVDTRNGCPWDLDVDGIMEGIDKCADTPRGWPVDEVGCPLDTDADGVPDGADKCAETPKGAIVRADGCPLDSDGDTVFDGIDRCPDTPKGAFVDAPDKDTAGCPHDSDNDRVFDGVDECPLTPEGAKVDARGCPTDTDGDKVLDGIDQCADTPKGGRVDKEGCPRVRLDKEEPQIVQNVKFLEGAELYPGSDAWLSLLLEALNYWTDLTVEIGVYTDKSGGAAANRQVATRRAEVVREWLVQQGVDRKRLVIKGYGAVNFVADNDTDEGKEKNRRVEVKRLSGDVRKHPKPVPETAPEPAPAEPAPPAAE
ncbi:MAG: OmpA family protein, partial [Candidatus Polarisedimenticolia bacterium]